MTARDDNSPTFGRRRPTHRITFENGDGKRAFHLDRGRLLAAGAAVVVVSLAYLGASAYLFFRDDILTGAISREIRAERAYEDRIASLRAEIDRINSRQLIDQEAFEEKIDKLLERQTALSATQAKLGPLLGRAGELGLEVPTAPRSPSIAPIGTPLPAAAPPAATPPAFDTDKFAVPLRSSGLAPLIGTAIAAERIADPVARIAAVERAVDGLEKRQTAALARLADLSESRERSWSRALARIGFRLADPAPSAALPARGAAVGGPFVPLKSDALHRADGALDRLSRLRAAARRLPLARPLPGDPQVTSEFGARLDPFLGIGALHTGIDFRADTGDAVRVTGPGTVIASGRQGGYGLCVDVDHGNGVVTRYGHLSATRVSSGDKVASGDVIGLAGSTGRSTGPHLHYETRIAGAAVDPRDWLEAGRILGF